MAEVRGDPWPGFEEDRLLVVQSANLAMTEVTVVDLATGGLSPVPIGSGSQQPAEPPPPPPAPVRPPEIQLEIPGLPPIIIPLPN
ncbi:hypothetical protein [Rhodococcus marinonascens]|uniref:hypothetical protein n=1 Tax=Rhodococcus marinonascens TaxID=38311 RepID=UPI000932A7FD|nr:hypothetical protein [Rhodococcus marinonascens]